MRRHALIVVLVLATLSGAGLWLASVWFPSEWYSGSPPPGGRFPLVNLECTEGRVIVNYFMDANSVPPAERQAEETEDVVRSGTGHQVLGVRVRTYYTYLSPAGVPQMTSTGVFTRARRVAFSGALPFLVIAPCAAVAIIARPVHRSVHRKGGLCPMCGYNLTSNVSGRCPECGSPAGGGPP